MSSNNLSSNLKCFICTTGFIGSIKAPNNSRILYETCSKYLHNGMIEKKAISKHFPDSALSFCPDCFAAAIELSERAKHQEMAQKNMSESIVSFTLGIIRRREQESDHEKDQGTSLSQPAVNPQTTVPECDSSTFSPGDNVKTLKAQASATSTYSCPSTSNSDDVQVKSFTPNDIKSITYPLVISHEQTRSVSTNEIEINAIKMEVDVDENNNVDHPKTVKDNEVTQTVELTTQNEDIPSKKKNSFSEVQFIKSVCFSKLCVVLQRLPSNEKGELVAGIQKERKPLLSKSDPMKISTVPKTEESDLTRPLYEQVKMEIEEDVLSENGDGLVDAMKILDQSVPSSDTVSKTKRSSVSSSVEHPKANGKESKSKTGTMRKKNIQCETCGKIVKLKMLKKHRNSKACLNGNVFTTQKITPTKNLSVKCSVCEKDFTDNSFLEEHMAIHSIEDFECYLCQKKFKNKAILADHIAQSHTGGKPCECPICGTKFWQAFHLKRHLKTHDEENSYKCDQCSFVCRTFSSLTTHKAKMHSKKRKITEKCVNVKN